MPDAPRPPQQRPAEKSMESAIVDIIVAVLGLLLVMGLLKSFFGSVVGSYIGFISWFYGGDWRMWYIVSAILVGMLDIALLAAAVFVIKRYNALRGETRQEEGTGQMISPEQEFHGNWQDIRRLMNSANPSDWNMAILRADAELDDLLSHLGYEGETIVERLKIVDPTKLRSMDRVWSAHRLRNTIAHDPLQQYTREMLMHALESYKIAFQELGVLHGVSKSMIQEHIPEEGDNASENETVTNNTTSN